MTHSAAPEDSDDVRWRDRVPVQVGYLRLQLPAALLVNSAATDGPSAVFEGAGVTVVVDAGPFADRLEAHIGKPAFQEAPVEVSGASGRRVSFDAPDTGTHTKAIHVDGPRPFTVAVIAAPSVPDTVAADVLASVRLARSREENP